MKLNMYLVDSSLIIQIKIGKVGNTFCFMIVYILLGDASWVINRPAGSCNKKTAFQSLGRPIACQGRRPSENYHITGMIS